MCTEVLKLSKTPKIRFFFKWGTRSANFDGAAAAAAVTLTIAAVTLTISVIGTLVSVLSR